MLVLQALLLLLCACAAAYYALSAFAVRAFFRRKRDFDPNFAPPVTILKPVAGVDADAYECFASFCRLDYPQYQLLFGTMDADDPALDVIVRLREEFPQCDIGVLVCGDTLGVNRKVSNLRNMARMARHNLLVICDSDMFAEPDYLRRVVQPFREPEVGMVTCPYRGRRARTFAALLEALGISTDFVPSTILAERLEGMRFAFGSTIAFPRRVLEAIGGWQAIADYLADDYQLGNRAAAVGFRVCLSDYVIETTLAPASMRAMLSHRLRWARTVRACRPAGYAGTFVTFGWVHALAFLAASHASALGWEVLGAVATSRILSAVFIGRRLRDRYALPWCWLLPAADLLAFAIWCASFLGSHVTWRGVRFRLLPGGKVVREGM